MVQLRNVLTLTVAGSSIVTAVANDRRSTQAAAQADAKAAVETFQSFFSTLHNSMDSGNQIAASELQATLAGYVGVLQTMTRQVGDNAVQTNNQTAAVSFPNIEGAVIGGVLLGLQGILTGAAMGATTQWTYKGLNSAITNIIGVDPMQALSGLLPGGATTPSIIQPLPEPKGGSAPKSGGGPPPKPASPPPKPASPPPTPKPAGGMDGMPGMGPHSRRG